ncbi:peptidylprolyl isomerase [Calycomorphotria hydatis]|uniref:peptidylprolyl isomerase n=1 Tax=Calycomorphotria hydatis TaxID=2528027 RepID=A0A517TEZ5_9PLAN|nr:peptidylprolyl isomerase [Calycomorphotria hydatis]QDT66939.1 Foldase protein PrsA 1 precursor [Calycomorphotria hydatis]
MRLPLRFFFALMFSFIAFEAMADPEAVLATVNDVPITQADLDFELTARKVPEDRREELTERYLNGLIDRELMRQFLTHRKAMPEPEQLREAIGRMRERLEVGGEDVDALFAKIGFTEDRLKRAVALPLAWQKQVRRMVTEKQIQSYFEQHRRQLDGTRLEVRHLFIGPRKKADDAQVSQTLADIRRQIIDGELTFAEAAKAHSTAPSAAAGGEIGWITYRGKLPKSVSDAAYELNEGEITSPVASPFGWHLVQVGTIEPGELSLEDARAEVVNQLADQLWANLVAQQKQTAEIVRAE